MMAELTTNELVLAYTHTRDQKKRLKEQQTEEMRPLNKRMEIIEGMLLERMNNREEESVRTPSGTAYKSHRTSVSILDWEAAFDFVQEHGLYHMLERRLSKAAVEEYLEAQGELPPGVKLTTEIQVNVRK